MGLEEFNNLTEIVSERSYTRKVYDLGDGDKRYRFHLAHKHYKDAQNNFQDIDTSLAFDNTAKKWKHNKASYLPEIPEYSDGWFSFRTQYEGKDFTLLARPVAGHILGTYYNDSEGKYVVYPNAFGTNIDLKVYAYWAGLKKVICIKEKPVDVSQDISFDFELTLPQGTSVKDALSDVEWDISKGIDFSGKAITLGNANGLVYFRDARVWDSNALNESVKIELRKQGNKIYLRKTITADILAKAVYPLYTDHPTSYYAGAGDGYISTTTTAADWATVVGRTSGTADYTSGYLWDYTAFVANVKTDCYRSFIPVDTSAIDDGASITAASLYLYCPSWGASDQDNDAYGYNVIVQTSQASSFELVANDFDNIGTTQGSNQIDTTSIVGVEGYIQFTLNATGRGWINKTGVTYLGLREGHDVETHAPNTSGDSGIVVYSSETTGTSTDPYLDVTTGAGSSSSSSRSSSSSSSSCLSSSSSCRSSSSSSCRSSSSSSSCRSSSSSSSSCRSSSSSSSSSRSSSSSSSSSSRSSSSSSSSSCRSSSSSSSSSQSSSSSSCRSSSSSSSVSSSSSSSSCRSSSSSSSSSCRSSSSSSSSSCRSSSSSSSSSSSCRSSSSCSSSSCRSSSSSSSSNSSSSSSSCRSSSSSSSSSSRSSSSSSCSSSSSNSSSSSSSSSCRSSSSSCSSSSSLSSGAAAIESYPTSNQDSLAGISDHHPADTGNNSAIGQMFIAPGNYDITSAKFYLKKTGSPTCNLYAAVYEAWDTEEGHIPLSDPIGISDALDASTLTTSLSLYTFTFSTPFHINEAGPTGGDYIVVVQAGSTGTLDGSNYISVGVDASSPTHAGHYVEYEASSWGFNMSVDTIFYLYGTAYSSSSSSCRSSSSSSSCLSSSSSSSSSQFSSSSSCRSSSSSSSQSSSSSSSSSCRSSSSSSCSSSSCRSSSSSSSSSSSCRSSSSCSSSSSSCRSSSSCSSSSSRSSSSSSCSSSSSSCLSSSSSSSSSCRSSSSSSSSSCRSSSSCSSSSSQSNSSSSSCSSSSSSLSLSNSISSSSSSCRSSSSSCSSSSCRSSSSCSSSSSSSSSCFYWRDRSESSGSYNDRSNNTGSWIDRGEQSGSWIDRQEELT